MLQRINAFDLNQANITFILYLKSCVPELKYKKRVPETMQLNVTSCGHNATETLRRYTYPSEYNYVHLKGMSWGFCGMIMATVSNKIIQYIYDRLGEQKAYRYTDISDRLKNAVEFATTTLTSSK